jgi:hypothetical protein
LLILIRLVGHDEKELRCLVNHMAYNSTPGLQENYTYTKLNIQGKHLIRKLCCVVYFLGFGYIAQCRQVLTSIQ